MKRFYLPIILIIFSICFTSCEIEDFLDDYPSQGKNPAHLALDSKEKQWLSFNGYWVFEDSLSKERYTVFCTSHSSVQSVTKTNSIYGNTYTSYTYDLVKMRLTNIECFTDDETIENLTLWLRSNGDTHPITLGSWTGKYSVTLFASEDVMNNQVDTITSFQIPSLDYRKFYLKRGRGIIRVEYNHNDSTNVLNLVGWGY